MKLQKIILMLLLPALSQMGEETQNPTTIVAFGDSITEGVIGVKPKDNWLRLLGEKLGDGYRLYNAGVGGNSARESMARFEKDVLRRKPDLILLEFGGNNTGIDNPKRRVDEEEFKKHLSDFKTRLPKGCIVIILTFPPIIDEWHKYGRHKSLHNGLDDKLEKQRDIVREFAKKNGYPLIDLHKLMWKRRHDLILKDGVHLNAAGQRYLADAVFSVLSQMTMKKSNAQPPLRR